MTMDSYKWLWRAIDRYGCCGWLWVVMDIVMANYDNGQL